MLSEPVALAKGPLGITCLAQDETRWGVQQDSRCSCASPASPKHADTTAEEHHHGWGLPTHACPATSYMVEAYPALHRKWLSEGRVLVHCSTSGGFGDYVKSLPSVVVLSMLTELALVLQCDVPAFDAWNKQRANELPRHLARLFAGAHFDWSIAVRLNSSANVIKGLDVTKRYSRSATSLRVFNNAFAYVRRLIKFNAQALKNKLGPYSDAPNDYDIDSCFLRYLLQPRPALTTMLDQALKKRTPRSGQRLVNAAATHVRMGDAVFKNDGWKDNKWMTASELRLNTFAQAPSRSLRCLMRASEITGVKGPHGCTPCVVVSDSPWVEQCARAILADPVITPGVAAHMLASGSDVIAQQANVDKIFLDWWLIARSQMSVDLGQGGKPSNFFWTAVGFKKISAPTGVVLRVNGSQLATPGGLNHCRTYRDTTYSYAYHVGAGARRPKALPTATPKRERPASQIRTTTPSQRTWQHQSNRARE